MANHTGAVNCSCQLTLNEFISLKEATPEEDGDDCSSNELIFQSGIHRVLNDHDKILTFDNISSVVIRGEVNATIKCLNQYLNIHFIEVSGITIQSMHIENCNIIETVHSREVHETQDQQFEMHVSDSKFTNTSISVNRVQTYDDDNQLLSSTSGTLLITIEDSNIENCVDSHFLNLDAEIDLITVTFKGLNFRCNNRPLLHYSMDDLDSPADSELLVEVTGINYFVSNNHSIFILQQSRLLFSRAEVNFINNSNHVDFNYDSSFGPIVLQSDSTALFEHSNVVFNNNQGGIFATETEIVFGDNATIYFDSNHSPRNGGALSLYSSTLIFNATKWNILLTFTKNKAEYLGSAIYVAEYMEGENLWATYESFHTCSIIRSIFDIQCDIALIKLIFDDNIGMPGQTVIFGGWIDWTEDKTSGVLNYRGDIINKIITFDTKSSTNAGSCPVRVCLCQDGQPLCNITTHTVAVYGYTVNLNIIAVGERYTPISSGILATVTSSSTGKMSHHTAAHKKYIVTCEEVTFKFTADEVIISIKQDLEIPNQHNVDNIQLNASIPHQQRLIFEQLSVRVRSLGCPVGFALNKLRGTCTCEELQGLTCDMVNTKIIRQRQQWIGLTYEHTKRNRSTGVIIYSPCPFDYCRTDNASLSVRLEDQDAICDFDRSGILCGGCRANFSRVLGSSKCKKCSNSITTMIALLVGQLTFGPVLVVSLMMLDLTVAVGTINGLTLYANIIYAQRTTFFTQDTSSSFLSMFIAWLNLDLGIETCIYDGLDEYAITWLNLPFPLYIWFLAGILIVLSHYSSRFSNFIGRNSIQVLATLFLISYARLLQIIIDVFSYATLTYPDGYIKTVWFVDGNVQYFKGKHIPLLLITTVFTVLTLPYTIVILSIQFLYKISHYRVMFWVQRLKPFFDAYTGPYKAKHRYWTGLLLLVRIILLIIFSTFQSRDSSVNLLAIAVSSFVLTGLSFLAGGVYESLLHNLLEALFLYNLGITSAAVLYDKHNTKVAVFTSTSVAFITSIFIILRHALKQLLRTKRGLMIKEKILDKLSFVKRKEQASTSEARSMSLSVPLGQFNTSVTSTTVELKEPLLDDDC